MSNVAPKKGHYRKKHLTPAEIIIDADNKRQVKKRVSKIGQLIENDHIKFQQRARGRSNNPALNLPLPEHRHVLLKRKVTP